MIRKTHSPIFLLMFSGLLFLSFLYGCNDVNGPESKAENQYSFSYDITDENGNLLTTITDKQIGESNANGSTGVFGTNFLPPWLLEGLENNGLDPEMFQSHQIYLHTETDSEGESHPYTMRFGFPLMQEWEIGVYQFPEISKEFHLNILRLMWSVRQNLRPFADTGQDLLSEAMNEEFSDKIASVAYSESGFATENSYGIRVDSTSVMYLPTKGTVELEVVTPDRIQGNFDVEMIGFTMKNVFFTDEFPEDPEFKSYHFTGDFTVVPGDYHDLVQNSESLFQEPE